jgi:translation initiation factor IF-3
VAPEVQVLLPDGQALGILPTKVAIARALEARLDLVEIAPAAQPPVCRMMDFGKFIADREKGRPEGG